MKVGEYCRNKKGNIGKIFNITKFTPTDLYRCIQCDKFEDYENNIIKSSPEIIDLIQVGDYVNGLKITLINEPSMANCNKRILYAEGEEGYLIKMFYYEEDIKSIVTKEQFESMEYKVKE